MRFPLAVVVADDVLIEEDPVTDGRQPGHVE
jgi:hypothetical protein